MMHVALPIPELLQWHTVKFREEYDAGQLATFTLKVESHLNYVEFDTPQARAHVTRDIVKRISLNRDIRAAYRAKFCGKLQVLDSVRILMSTTLRILAQYFSERKVNQESLTTLCEHIVAHTDFLVT